MFGFLIGAQRFQIYHARVTCDACRMLHAILGTVEFPQLEFRVARSVVLRVMHLDGMDGLTRQLESRKCVFEIMTVSNLGNTFSNLGHRRISEMMSRTARKYIFEFRTHQDVRFSHSRFQIYHAHVTCDACRMLHASFGTVEFPQLKFRVARSFVLRVKRRVLHLDGMDGLARQLETQTTQHISMIYVFISMISHIM